MTSGRTEGGHYVRKAWWIGAGIVTGWAIHRYAYSYPMLPELSAPKPVDTPAEAVATLHRLDAADGQSLLPVCRTRIWADNKRSKSCIVLLHGYTNCPNQFARLGSELHEDGHAVIAARLPFHGQVNRRPDNLGKMSVEALAHFVATVIDAAHGLGERVTLLGFSFGGVLAGWAAQRRADIDHAVLVSPSLGPAAVATWQRPLYSRLLPFLPDRFLWWDPVAKMDKLGPKHAYVGYSTKGVGVMLGLGGGLLSAARRAQPMAKRVTVVVNPHDDVIDNDAARAVAYAWQKRDSSVRLVHFPEHLHLIHDLMDPEQPGQQVEQVYPFVRTEVLGAK